MGMRSCTAGWSVIECCCWWWWRWRWWRRWWYHILLGATFRGFVVVGPSSSIAFVILFAYVMPKFVLLLRYNWSPFGCGSDSCCRWGGQIVVCVGGDVNGRGWWMGDSSWWHLCRIAHFTRRYWPFISMLFNFFQRSMRWLHDVKIMSFQFVPLQWKWSVFKAIYWKFDIKNSRFDREERKGIDLGDTWNKLRRPDAGRMHVFQKQTTKIKLPTYSTT